MGDIVFPPCRSKSGRDKGGATSVSQWERLGQPPSNLPATQFNSIQTGRYPLNWWTYLIGYGPTLHVTGQNSLNPQAVFLNSNFGGDTSVLFTAHIDYGYVIATEEQLTRIRNIKKREFMRRGINQHTLEKICKPEPVRASKFAKCMKALEEYELQKGKNQVKEHGMTAIDV